MRAALCSTAVLCACGLANAQIYISSLDANGHFGRYDIGGGQIRPAT